jgi:hypothetical protein
MSITRLTPSGSAPPRHPGLLAIGNALEIEIDFVRAIELAILGLGETNSIETTPITTLTTAHAERLRTIADKLDDL